jgi:hypothetical protein
MASDDALPVASVLATECTVIKMILITGGKVTPVRYEYGLQDDSGQEENVRTFIHVFDSRMSRKIITHVFGCSNDHFLVHMTMRTRHEMA